MSAAPSLLERRRRKDYHSAFMDLYRQCDISSFVFVPSIPSAPPHSVCSRQGQHTYPPEPADPPLYPTVDEGQGGYAAVTDKVVKPFKKSLVWVFDNIIRRVPYFQIPSSSPMHRIQALESRFVETLKDDDASFTPWVEDRFAPDVSFPNQDEERWAVLDNRSATSFGGKGDAVNRSQH